MAQAAPILLDTCAIIWLANGSPVSSASRTAIDAATSNGEVHVSPISAWEIGRLAASPKSQLDFAPSPIAWFERFLRLPGVQLAPFTIEVAVDASFLPGVPHGDPVDRLLIATARRMSATLVTRDAAILDYARGGHLRAIKC